MFSRKTEQNGPKTDSLIAHEVSIHGDVHISGALYLDGSVKGNIIAPQETGAMLTLSEKGRVEGCVQVPETSISGTVLGDVYAAQRVHLKGSARVVGDVYYNVLEMEAGAEVTGHLVFCEPDDDQINPFSIANDPRVPRDKAPHKATEHYIRSLTNGSNK